jgi:hypothetical protein
MAQHRKQCHIMCKLWCQLISVQNHRQGVEDLRNAHFLPVSGSRSWEMPDCAFELVDDRDKLVCFGSGRFSPIGHIREIGSQATDLPNVC